MTDRSIVAGQCMPVSVVLLAKRTRGRPFLVFYHWESRLELETLAVFQFGLEVQVQRRERIKTAELLMFGLWRSIYSELYPVDGSSASCKNAANLQLTSCLHPPVITY